MTRRSPVKIFALVVCLHLVACGGERLRLNPECPPGLPCSGLYAKFGVIDEFFHVSITNPAGIEQAIALWEGRSQATIPVGTLVCKPIAWNSPWSWYLEPTTLEFGEAAVEVCDGRPSYVEADCSAFGPTYCPWAAVLVELRDCRTNPDCPVMPR